MDFVAIDVETANADMASICQIGLVRYDSGTLAAEWKTYVDPKDYFDGVNMSIHGISESTVKGAPAFADVAGTLRAYLEGNIVVCHTHFDRVAIHQAGERHGVPIPDCTWLDSARVARRAWAQCARKGYGLHNVCKMIGYKFQHHDALEDAKAAAHVLLAAIDESGIDLRGWLTRVNRHIPKSANVTRGRAVVQREGRSDGPLNGEVLVFTGGVGMPRQHAADLAVQAGGAVASSVTKKTTILVVGDQDVTRLAGHKKSSKLRKAEELIEKGSPIRILRASDFEELLRLADCA
jgi:DNA polymerase III subunit epsilon